MCQFASVLERAAMAGKQAVYLARTCSLHLLSCVNLAQYLVARVYNSHQVWLVL